MGEPVAEESALVFSLHSGAGGRCYFEAVQRRRVGEGEFLSSSSGAKCPRKESISCCRGARALHYVDGAARSHQDAHYEVAMSIRSS